MPIISDFALISYENGVFTIGINPPAPIGGYGIQFDMMGRVGGIPVVTKSMNSGYYGVSGMDIVNSGQGIFNITLLPSEVSGLQLIRGNWFYNVQRTDSGSATSYSQGYRQLPM